MDSGQYSVTTSADAIGSGGCSGGLILCAHSDNQVPVFIGASGVTTSDGFEMKPGQVIDFSTWMSMPYDISQIFAVVSSAASNPKVCWLKQA